MRLADAFHTPWREITERYGVELKRRLVDADGRRARFDDGTGLESRRGHLGDRLPPRLLLKDEAEFIAGQIESTTPARRVSDADTTEDEGAPTPQKAGASEQI